MASVRQGSRLDAKSLIFQHKNLREDTNVIAQKIPGNTYCVNESPEDRDFVHKLLDIK